MRLKLCVTCFFTLRWFHNGHDSVSNHQPHDCLLHRLFRRRSKRTSKLRVTGLCAGNSSGTGEFPTQMASNTENVSIWWRHLEYLLSSKITLTSPNTRFYGHERWPWSIIAVLVDAPTEDNEISVVETSRPLSNMVVLMTMIGMAPESQWNQHGAC